MWGPAGGGKGDLPFFGSATQGSWAWCQGTLGPHWRLGERSVRKWAVNRPCYREPGKACDTLTLTVRVPKPRPGVDEQWNMAQHQAGQRAAAVMVWGWREEATGGLGNRTQCAKYRHLMPERQGEVDPRGSRPLLHCLIGLPPQSAHTIEDASIKNLKMVDTRASN